MIKILTGNIFTTKCSTIVNTVNCVGVMGAGIAYEFRLRYPKMHERYKEICKYNLLKIGTLWIYRADNKNILNFPTKIDWKKQSKTEYLEKGLQKFIDTYHCTVEDFVMKQKIKIYHQQGAASRVILPVVKK